MKTSKHTPGPWECNTKEEVELGTDWPKFYEVSAINSTHWLCRILSRNGKRKEAEANAKLIAVAPEMFEVLKEIRGFISTVPFSHPYLAKIDTILLKLK